jgi:hypothetical protein
MDQYMPGLSVPRGFIPFGVLLGAILLFLNALYNLMSFLRSVRDDGDDNIPHSDDS